MTSAQGLARSSTDRDFFMAGGPHLIAGNFPRATEIMVDYITGLLLYARANGRSYVAPDEDAIEPLWKGQRFPLGAMEAFGPS